MILVSACLAGVECRYNGSSYPIPEVVEMVKKGDAMPICPELLAGLPIPRPPAEQQNGMIISSNGEDQTSDYLIGATIALKIALLINCNKAILKSNSPTCGCGVIYDGTFSGHLINGDGIFAKLLKENGIKVCTID
ncbi:MAG: hypothetical protein H6Q72_2942 [Firmicutes bacterium]|nr:hypothetical protein [Bacillota bacterium]